MVSSARLGVLLAALVAATTAATGSLGLGVPAEAWAGPSVSVHGRLLVVPAEVPGGHTSYGVALADGDIVPVRGPFDPTVRTGAVFDGRLGLPSGVLDTLSRRGESGATAALRVVDRRSLTLQVQGTPSVTQSTSAAVTPTTHQQFVAALDGKGALTQTDAQLLTHVTNIGTYWETQSNGAIAGITVPSTVEHFTSSKAQADCGLGNDFDAVVQDAAHQFPSLDLSQNSPDQLVVFVPPSCSSGGIVGEGSVGSSFASGGVLIVKAGDSIESTYGHETGHNYGFEHANARYGTDSMEYYGVYDVMGFAIGGYDQLTALSTPYRVFEGVTDPGEIDDVDLGNGLSPVHATATISARSSSTGVRSVRVQDPASGDELYLDYRSGGGEDAGSFYTNAQGYYLSSDHGAMRYASGVTINAPRDDGGVSGSGVDTIVVDGSGDTSLPSGASWVDAAGLLTVTVTGTTPTAATVKVDYAPPQDFASVGKPAIGGSVRVGGRVSLDTGTWVPAPRTTQVRWTADGKNLPSLKGKTRFTAGPGLLGKRLVATVIASRPGYTTTKAVSAAVRVKPGRLAASAPTISGRPEVGRTLTAKHGRWTAGTTFSYAWYADGKRIRHRAAPRLVVTRAQRGARITVKVTGRKAGYTSVSRTSPRTHRVR